MMAAHLGGQAGCRMVSVPWERAKPVPAGGGNTEMRDRRGPGIWTASDPRSFRVGLGGGNDKTPAL